MEIAAPEELDWQVRAFVYARFAEQAEPPTAAQTAAAFGIAEERAAEAYRRLDARHAIILEPSGDTVRMANPFSAVPTAFRVYAGDRAYWANCAWDMLGLAVVLHSDVRIQVTCPGSAEAHHLAVEGDQVKGSGELVHFPQPFARWYDDLIATCASMLLFQTEAEVDAWCRERQMPRGALLTLAQVWALSKPWYATRMSPEYHGRSAAEAQAVFAQVGLVSDFWHAPAHG